MNLLNRIFAGIALGGTALAFPALAGADDPPRGLSCVRVNDDGTAAGKDRVMAHYLREIHKSALGRRVMADAARTKTKICFDHDMPQASAQGPSFVGVYIAQQNTIFMNPWYPPAASIPSIVHESRHLQHTLAQIDFMQDGNYPETDRMALSWLVEADARVANVLFAWEMERAGDKSYMDALKARDGYDAMVAAFSGALADDPDNMTGAMGAIVRAFRGNPGVVRIYDLGNAAYIDKMKKEFNANKPEQDLLTDDVLRRVGDWGPYGNYMTPDMMNYIRGSVTQDDYTKARDAMRPQTPEEPPAGPKKRHVGGLVS